ncbi:MAG TPA: hypothetical protein VN458_08020 [Solirubrobacterales bacterium]|nr:hypothetical protein [Solirubrobacterales bacterium]
MRTRRRIALLLCSAAALGVGLIAFPASSAAAPPVVPTCNPVASTGSDSCVSGKVTAVSPPLGTALEPIKLGTRVRSVFSPSTDETTKVVVKYDDAGTINLAGIPSCPSSELVNKNVSQAWEQCGPGADGSPASEGNAYLSTGLGNNVSGIASTIPNGGGAVACVMIFKGADNTHITLFARAPANTSGCDNPATNTGGTTTVLFTGTLTQQPASSPYGWTLTVPNTQTADPALDDYYATTSRGSAFRAKCENPLKIQATFTYTSTPTDTVNGTNQTCP